MSQKNRSKRAKNTQPDFDLDEYLEKKHRNMSRPSRKQGRQRSILKNMIAILSVSIFCMLWYFDWDPVKAKTALMEFDPSSPLEIINEADERISDTGVSQYVIINNAESSASDLGSISYTEYLELLNEKDLLDKFGSYSSSNLYQNGVSPEYIILLDKAGVLDKFGSNSISRLYSNEVSPDYLSDMRNAGVLEPFGSTSISRLYQNGVTVEYLSVLKEKDLLSNLSSSAIVKAYQSDN